MAASWFEQIKQRRVFRALVGYGIVSFALLQVVEPIMHGLSLPEWVLATTVIGLGLGFPMTLVLAWIFDVNAGRIESTGPRPRAAILLLLTALGVALGAPGVGWYFWRQARAPSTDLRATLDAVPPASDIRAAPSIAVLPLVNLSRDPDQEYFADGLAEELLNLLTKVPGLRVAARTSAFAFKGKNEDVAEIGQKLHVAHILEGSVRRSGDHVRIATQLINASDGFHVWSETYDRKLADVFVVQDEIARAVVAALKLKLLPEQAPTTIDRRTANPEAYNQYLLGRQILGQESPKTTPRAVEALERALALDPGYAPAWAELANAQLFIAGSAGGTLTQRPSRLRPGSPMPTLLEGGRGSGRVWTGLAAVTIWSTRLRSTRRTPVPFATTRKTPSCRGACWPRPSRLRARPPSSTRSARSPGPPSAGFSRSQAASRRAAKSLTAHWRSAPETIWQGCGGASSICWHACRRKPSLAPPASPPSGAA